MFRILVAACAILTIVSGSSGGEIYLTESPSGVLSTEAFPEEEIVIGSRSSFTMLPSFSGVDFDESTIILYLMDTNGEPVDIPLTRDWQQTTEGQ